ncbi:PilZ domain-containing protein [Bradyrhizobium sp. dw_78]|uniref:PilZ domain-containing protein n=1 Tax=Bradyrhizobium sp. dw_78 TaxID=2719793 RepID=UPI001BD47FD8|nr:PilZ domain-containing protein [Bradyrhizobium sp. dw_78]
MHPRRFARMRPSGKVSNAAKIIVDPKTPPIDCTIVDYSAGGACLQVIYGTTLPMRFDLLHGGTKKRCRIVWKERQRIGVTF